MKLGTAAKALALLDHFSRARARIGLSELARLSGVNKATCHRLLADLAAHGLVEQVGLGREYQIGPGVLRLAALREAAVPLKAGLMPVLTGLAQATGETAHASHLVAGRLVTLAFAYGAASGTQVLMEDADVLPFHATSSGLAVLAFLGPDLARPILQGALPALTPATPRAPGELRASLEAVRARGYAQTLGTFEADVASLALPLFDAEARVLGALAVAAPAARMTGPARGAALGALAAHARAAMQNWGGALPPDLDAPWRALEQGAQA